jgi:hypothetical protein
MLIVREIHGGGNVSEIARFTSIGQALAFLPGKRVMVEEDADHPGCFDAMMECAGQLRQFTIEPEGFKL